MFFHWLRKRVRVKSGVSGRKHRPRARTARPILEALEDRTVPSTLTWTGAAGDNNWDTAANWYTGSSVAAAPPTNGDNVVINGGTVNLSHAASIASLSFSGGTLAGAGDVTVTGPFTWEGGTVGNAGGVTLDGNSAISTNPFLDGATLTNHGTVTVTATGGIMIINDGRFVNAADGTLVVQGNAAFGNLSDHGPPGFLDNYGTVETQGTGATVFAAVVTNEAGAVIQADAGTLVLGGGGYSYATPRWGGSYDGTVRQRPGGPGAGVQFDGTSAFAATSAIDFGQVTFSYTFGGPTAVAGSFSAASTTVAGASVAFTGSDVRPGALTVSGSGSVDFSAAGQSAVTLASLDLEHAELTGSADVYVTGPAALDGFDLEGAGTLYAEGGLTLASGGHSYLLRPVVNAGAAAWLSGDVYVEADGTFTNLPQATFTATRNASWDGYGTPATFENQGTFVVQGATGQTSIDVPFDNSGAVDVQAGTLALSGSYTQTAGSTILDGGNISGALVIQGGVLKGTGTIFGSVTNGGQVSPGFSPGRITVQGDYTQTSTGDFAAEIRRLGAGTDYDQVDVAGSVTLAGSLHVSLLGGFAPLPGASFTILDNQGHGTVSGAFASLPEGQTFIAGGYLWQISYQGRSDPDGIANDVVLTVIQAATTTAVTSSADPSVFGQAVTFTATVTANAAGAATPTGTVQFVIDGQNYGAPVALSGGSAALTTSALAAGTHVIGAVYGGDGTFLGSSATLSQEVDKARPTFGAVGTTVITDGTPSVTLSGTLSYGTLIPTGSVTVTLDGLSQTTAIGAGGAFSATFATGALSVGVHQVTLGYGGDPNFTDASASGSLDDTYGILAMVHGHGNTLDFQIELATAGGQDVSSGVAVTALGIAATTDTTDTVGAADPSTIGTLIPPQPPGGSNPSNRFTYQGGHTPSYAYHLNISGLAAGTYRLYFSVAGDPLDHWVTFTVS
jgi:hypothetical protein